MGLFVNIGRSMDDALCGEGRYADAGEDMTKILGDVRTHTQNILARERETRSKEERCSDVYSYREIIFLYRLP